MVMNPDEKKAKSYPSNYWQAMEGRCLFLGDFVEGKPKAQLEDIFPEDLYMEAVREAYSTPDLALGEEEKSIEGVVNKVIALFKRKRSDRFEKWRPAAVLRDWITSKPEKIPDEVWGTASRIFDEVNKAFETRNSTEQSHGR
ncbi:MAG: hypothetical protein KatS3mg110_0870 [Pirellulaceae bacterium]|nr:MAG: hypothetical protein KatS3mg110_0870 [Pirellulaceae bacterium]